ncbi:MAG: family 43 glycosylhydrolase [Paludibacter sp.]|nr:family 43 glycosylhydrolase [Paludibacter sp.]
MKMFKRGLVLCMFALMSAAMVAQEKEYIVNGTEWLDTEGNVINAHGGGMLKVGDYYYWIGENRRDGVFVSCYRSKDLMNWEFRGHLLTRDSHAELDKANIERPKVVYNQKTGKYVMWMHYEYGGNYDKARAAVAWSDDIEKPFTYVKSFRPFDNMSRDCTLYRDSDGTAYFLSAARENYDLILYKLTDDYLDVKEQLLTLWPGGHREAPAIVKRGKYYFLMTSGCTGWAPNQGKYAYAKSLTGPWSELKNIGDNVTFDTQSTFIVPVEGKKQTSYLYIGDRWDGRRYFNSKYIFFPLSFPNDTTMELRNVEKVKIDVKAGQIN